MIYRALLRPLLFRLDPERSHELLLWALGALGPLWRRWPGPPADPRLGITVCGIRFPHPVGLAAGFDKAGRALGAWPALGFGFVEVGTVTAVPQPGNPRPRLFRLPEDDALINRLGFNSPGAEAVARRLALLRASPRPYPVPLAVNIGRSRAVPPERALDDHLACFDRVQPHADFVVLNVSSPNTPGLRALQKRNQLLPLLDALARRNRELGPKPLFVKVAPDLDDADLESLAEAVLGRASGIVATNTTVSREGLRSPARREEGGVSGRPLREQATRVLRTLYRLTRGALPLVGVGGIFTARDAYERIKAGASLVEVYTGFVYEGPGLPRRIVAGLRELLDRDGLRTLADAVGLEAEGPRPSPPLPSARR